MTGTTWGVSDVNETQHLLLSLSSKSSTDGGWARSGAELVLE